MTGVLRLVLRTQPRSGKFARHATIRTDTDRLQVCAAPFQFRRAGYIRQIREALFDTNPTERV